MSACTPLIPEVKERSKDNSKINGRLISSYSISQPYHGEPLLEIPGHVGVWYENPKCKKLKQDSGMYYRDQNRARFLEYIMEPLMHSVLTMRPDYNLRDVSVVSDRNILRQLYQNKYKNLTKYPPKKGPFDAVLLGGTLILRRIGVPLDGVSKQSYGHSFEDNFTSYTDIQSAATTGSWRSHEFVINGSKYLVRSELDAVFVGLDDPSYKYLGVGDSAVNGKPIPVDPDLSIPKSSMRINDHAKQDVREACELKSRRADLPLMLEDNYLQMVLGNCNYLCAAFHRLGVIVRIEKLTRSDVEAKIGVEVVEDILKGLIAVDEYLEEIKKTLRKTPGVVHRIDGDSIEVVDGSPLPLSTPMRKYFE